MREFPLVGPHRRLRIDFADVEVEESTVDEAGRRSCSSKYNDYPDASRGGEEPLNRHRSRGSDISSTRSGLTSSLSVADLSQKAPPKNGQRPVLCLGYECTPPRSKKTADLV